MMGTVAIALAIPGAKTRKGSGTSTTNMPSMQALRTHIGALWKYQPPGEGSGWVIRKPFR